MPLLIADPSKPGNRVVRQTVTLVDIFPTVCDLADVQYPTKPDGSDYLDGLSLIDLLDVCDLCRCQWTERFSGNHPERYNTE